MTTTAPSGGALSRGVKRGDRKRDQLGVKPGIRGAAKRVAPDQSLRKETEVSKDLSNSKKRDKLKKSSFALPGKEKYPIPDIEHARNAWPGWPNMAPKPRRGSSGRRSRRSIRASRRGRLTLTPLMNRGCNLVLPGTPRPTEREVSPGVGL